MELKEKTIRETTVYDGHIIKVRLDEAELPDGSTAPREVVVHPGGVGIALEDEEGKFFFVTQYRYGQGHIMLEYPAGKRSRERIRWKPQSVKSSRRPAMKEKTLSISDHWFRHPPMTVK